MTAKLVELSGILDGTRLEEVKQTMEDLDLSAGEQVLIDIGNVEFMDSSGLSSLIMALKHARAMNANVALCSPTAQVKMLLELTSMDQLFSIYSDQASFTQAQEILGSLR